MGVKFADPFVQSINCVGLHSSGPKAPILRYNYYKILIRKVITDLPSALKYGILSQLVYDLKHKGNWISKTRAKLIF